MKKSELFKINDNELIFLMRQGSEEASKILYQKYHYLIRKKSIQFKSSEYKNVDFLQEGQIALIKAASTYDFTKDKTFNKYFELVLERRFISLIRKSNTIAKREVKRLALEEEASIITQEAELDLSLVIGKLSNQEMIIYTMRIIERKSVEFICKSLNLEPKQVYNTVSRVKEKIKKAKEINK